MMERLFRLKENKTSVKIEVVAGTTTFLTVMYILFVNSTILAATGMPYQGAFVATALSAAVCTLFVSLYANLPVAMAPGMSINTFFVNTICLGMGFHWREALAITFITGVLQLLIMGTSVRKTLVNAIPNSLRIASGAGLGVFIGYIAIKNAGFINYVIPAESFNILPNGIMLADSSVSANMTASFGTTHIIAIIAMITLIIFLALEKRTGARYNALAMSILIATFAGIPLSMSRIRLGSGFTMSGFDAFREVALGFFGRPGLQSLFDDPGKALSVLLVVVPLLLTTSLDSVGTMIGIGHIENMTLFDEKQLAQFRTQNTASKVDRALLSNAFGGVVAPLIGTSPVVIYLESVTGMLSGGRTGLTGVTVALLFLVCLPLAGFFHIIPVEAVAPAMLVAGLSMISRLKHIDWSDIAEALPAFMTLLFIPLTLSILDGMCIGILCYVVVHLALREAKKIHPMLYIISFAYILGKLGMLLR